MSSEHGTYKTVTARFWPRFPPESSLWSATRRYYPKLWWRGATPNFDSETRFPTVRMVSGFVWFGLANLTQGLGVGVDGAGMRSCLTFSCQERCFKTRLSKVNLPTNPSTYLLLFHVMKLIWRVCGCIANLVGVDSGGRAFRSVSITTDLIQIKYLIKGLLNAAILPLLRYYFRA